MDTTWMTIEEAANYLGLGKTVLYGFVKDGKIPANKISNKWVIEKGILDAWVKASKPIEQFFTTIDFILEENPSLREPQIEAYKSLYDYFSNGGKTAIVQIPVGCGKSGLAAIIPFGIAQGRMLVITPNVTIKKGMFDSFNISNRQQCFWRRRGVLKDEDMIGGPFACTLDTGNISVCEKSHIVITNIQQLSTNTDKWLKKFSEDFFDLIIIDEAHHSKAKSWTQIIKHFPNAKIVNMTATPFRSDKQEIEGELVYRYPFKRATIQGYVKRVKAWYVAPCELTFTVSGEERTYSLNDILKMKEEIWFSRGVALSAICNQSIVDNSLAKLENLRQTGTHHQLIAVACSISHAKTIRSMYAERGYHAGVIYSQMDEDEQIEVLRKLKNGELDCIVQVQMLGEGFDHPKLSVAAIFRPFRTLSPYIQFIGRILRVIVQNDPNHPDNYGHIVTHQGMNLDERLKEFKLFEKDDQQFWEKVIGGEEPLISTAIQDGLGRMRNTEQVIVNNEIADSLIEEDFVSPDEEDLITDLEQKLEQLGLDPARARSLVLEQQNPKQNISKAAEPFPILPQKEWDESRKRLKEEVNRSANLLLNRLGLKRTDRKLNALGIPASNDFTACIVLINKEIKKINPEPRQSWTTENFKTILVNLDPILKDITREYKGRLNG